jgi:hypothetical protein
VKFDILLLLALCGMVVVGTLLVTAVISAFIDRQFVGITVSLSAYELIMAYTFYCLRELNPKDKREYHGM